MGLRVFLWVLGAFYGSKAVSVGLRAFLWVRGCSYGSEITHPPPRPPARVGPVPQRQLLPGREIPPGLPVSAENRENFGAGKRGRGAPPRPLTPPFPPHPSFLPNHVTFTDAYPQKAFCGLFSDDGSLFVSACQGTGGAGEPHIYGARGGHALPLDSSPSPQTTPYGSTSAGGGRGCASSEPPAAATSAGASSTSSSPPTPPTASTPAGPTTVRGVAGGGRGHGAWSRRGGGV